MTDATRDPRPERTRRDWLKRLAAVGLAVSPITDARVSAATPERYPSRPIRIVVPWAPGGLVDSGGRILSELLFRAFGLPAPVENVPGAAGTLGADQVAKAPADGHTLLMATSSLTIDVAVGRRTPYDPTIDLAPVALVADTHSVVIVPPDSPIESIGQLIESAKRKPGELLYGTPGIGSPAHLFSALFCQTAGIEMLHVPYGRTRAINDLLGGRLSVMFSTVPSALLQIRNKQVRPLAVTGPRRISSLPEVPTVIEAGLPGYEAGQWLGVFAPKGTPDDVVARLNQATTQAIESPAVGAELKQRGLEPRTGTPAEFARLFAADVAKWRNVIQKAGIQLKS
ncbi:MAG: Bug family tripartite tricarboxylate transporter substrate binding protein [Lautropia sp.]